MQQSKFIDIPFCSLVLTGNHFSTKKGPCEQGYNFIPIAFSVMLYVVYLMECWHCKTRLDLLCKVCWFYVYNSIKIDLKVLISMFRLMYNPFTITLINLEQRRPWCGGEPCVIIIFGEHGKLPGVAAR